MAVFTHPASPLKCGGAPQKIAYLAADYWRKQKLLDLIRTASRTRRCSRWPPGHRSWRRRPPGTGIEARLRSEMTACF